MRVLKAREMQELDKFTIEVLGIPGLVLMENAARGICEVVSRVLPSGKIAVVCGKGNNGGDGLAAARNLYNMGYEVSVFLTAPVEELKGDAKKNAEILSSLPVRIEVIREDSLDRLKSSLSESDLTIDALFGTGLSKPLGGFYEELVNLINRFAKKVLAVDLPSGLSADSPKPIGVCVKADYTVTFAHPKVAHIFPPASEFVGELFIVDISIPQSVSQSMAPNRYILSLEEVSLLFPERKQMSHKYTYGHVAVIGGSLGKTGAPSMAAISALRVGAGLSTIIAPRSLAPIFETKLTEVMTLPIGKGEKDFFGIDHLEETFLAVERGKFSTLLVGPGLGNKSDSYEFVREFLRSKPLLPLVIDADGINALAQEPHILNLLEVPVVLTPHIGEFSRLASIPKEEVLASLPDVALDFATKFGVYLVLKSSRTVVATPDGELFVNIRGNPGMATAGTGDVLAGVIAGFLAMGMGAANASKLGVFLHSLAGDMAAARKTQESLIATDIIEELPEAIAWLKEREIRKTKKLITALRELVGEE